MRLATFDVGFRHGDLRTRPACRRIDLWQCCSLFFCSLLLLVVCSLIERKRDGFFFRALFFDVVFVDDLFFFSSLSPAILCSDCAVLFHVYVSMCFVAAQYFSFFLYRSCARCVFVAVDLIFARSASQINIRSFSLK